MSGLETPAEAVPVKTATTSEKTFILQMIYFIGATVYSFCGWNTFIRRDVVGTGTVSDTGNKFIGTTIKM
jgi:hypothetical protein